MTSHAKILTILDDVTEDINRESYAVALYHLEAARSLVREQEAELLAEVKSLNTRLSEQIQISREALRCQSR